MNTSVEAFHTNCLVTWQAYNCPVCYYIKNPDLMKNSACMKCDTTESKWFCLICGHVGCGQDVRAHALEHYKETKHKYAMELNNFRVWDYNLQVTLHSFTNKDNEQQLDNLQICVQKIEATGCCCPVCCHLSTPKLFKQPICMRCEMSGISKLWICLFCSYVGCARQFNRHALEHYAKTKHPYTMQLENFSVWDYNEHKYMHRQLNEAMAKNEIVEHDSENLKEYFERRMNRLEHEWLEFCKLTEANNKMINIEERLLILAEEKKQLEEKLFEHDSKLNELLQQIVKNRQRQAFLTPHTIDNNYRTNMIKAEQSEEINKTENQQDIQPEAEPNNNFYINQRVLNPPKLCSKFQKSKFISLIILGLFIYHLLILIFQNLGQIILNFVNF